jgi:hypothetical protein
VSREIVVHSSIPSAAGIAKIAAVSIAIGGAATLRGASGAFVKAVVTRTAGAAVARQVMRSSKVAARVAPVLALAELAVDQAATKAALERGDLTDAEYQRETIGNVGNAAVGLGGAAGGAALGTLVLPGVGTLVGGVLARL